ncbi:MAG: hypothetical protein PUC42_04300 [Bacteroidales bacterium]|jgi:hypothetical protein|nr:hypothetical protein [Bacteroidales bacterium]MEE1260525.1 hypothetical protein [Paludibacteraceae bacterium]
MAGKESQKKINQISEESKQPAEVTKKVTKLDVTEGLPLERLSLGDAIARLTDIVSKNEENMEKAFSDVPEWQARTQLSMSTFRKETEMGAKGKPKKEIHTIVKVPSTFTDEQKELLKEYAIEMGGTYTNIKVEDTLPDGTVEESFPAQIEFSKDSAYSAEICAKMLLGENKEDILKELMERKIIQEERQKAIEEREKGGNGKINK